MNGKTLLAKLLGSTAAPAAAVAVASGAAGISPEQQAAGTAELEGIAENAYEEGRSAGMIEGRTAERERFGAVLTGDAASDHMGLAITLLSTTDNTPDQINAALAAAGPRITVAPATPAAATPPGQRQSADPLSGSGDPIADATSLVDPGAPQAPVDGPDEQAIVELWGGALATLNGGGSVTKGSVWDGLVPDLAN